MTPYYLKVYDKKVFSNLIKKSNWYYFYFHEAINKLTKILNPKRNQKTYSKARIKKEVAEWRSKEIPKNLKRQRTQIGYPWVWNLGPYRRSANAFKISHIGCSQMSFSFKWNCLWFKSVHWNDLWGNVGLECSSLNKKEEKTCIKWLKIREQIKTEKFIEEIKER